MSRDRYIFPAIFDYTEDGISIELLDLPGCLPSAHDPEEGLKNPREAMGLHLWGMEVDGEDIPEVTPRTRLRPQPNQVVVLVDLWMPAARVGVDSRNQSVDERLGNIYHA